MHRRILCFGILLLASLLVFGDWIYSDITVNIPADGFSASEISFGVQEGATDGYDEGIDGVSPPCPPAAPCVFFPVVDDLVSQLLRDIRGPVDPGDSIIWTIQISGTMNPGNVSWVSTSLPDGDFYLIGAYPGAPIDWDDATDMTTSTSADFMPAQQVKILYISPTEVAEDTEPPIVTGMIPENGATGVSPTATVQFEIVDVGSAAEVDPTSVAITINGIPFPGPITYATPITRGYRFSISPADVPMIDEWPEGRHVLRIDACDPIPNCMETFEYSFTVEAASEEFSVSGRAELVGETDHSGVTVAIEDLGMDYTTGADGTWEFDLPDAGSHTVTATMAGFVPASVEFTVSADRPVSTGHVLTLVPEGAEEVRLYGHVYLSDDPSDLSGSVVDVEGYGSATTLVRGNYEITDLPVDTDLSVTVSRPGYVTHTTTLRLSADTEQDFTLEREAGPSFTVSGNFTLEGETDHSGITVELTGEEPVTTDATGRYLFTEIEPGDYTITASKDGFVTFTEAFSVVDGDVTISAELAEREVVLAPPSGVNASEGYLYWIVVRWDAPLESGLYEIYYDDGVADDAGGGWTHIGIGGDPTWEMGVEFTPPMADCVLLSIRYNFLVNHSGTGTPTMDVRIRRLLADMPDTELIPGPIYHELSVDPEGGADWFVYEIPGGLELGSLRDFFCGFRDAVIGRDTTALYIGCDKSGSDDRSWIFMPDAGWNRVSGFSAPATIDLSDFMIRALVRLPDGSLCEIAPDGSGIPPRFFPPTTTRFDEAPRAAVISPEGTNPFAVDLAVSRDFARHHEVIRRDFSPSSAMSEVVEYNVYRSESRFSAIDDPGVELVGTTPADSLVFYDSFMDTLTTIDPFQWMYYGVTAVYDEGESDLGIIDSGYYVDFYPAARILLVDLTGGVDIASGGTESEPDFFYRIMTTDLGIPADDIYQTGIGEGIGRALLESYELVIIVSGMMSGTTIDLTRREWAALKEYIDEGGQVYYEGCVTPLRYFREDTTADFYDFYQYFGYNHSYPDYISHSNDTGNVLWCETTDDFLAVTRGNYIRMDYLTWTVADFRVAELQPRPGAQGWFQSQPDSPTIPIPFSRTRMIYYPRPATGAATVYSSVYLGSFEDEAYPQTRSRLMGLLLWGAFGIENDMSIKEELGWRPTEYMLEGNMPNPFNAKTSIRFRLPEDTDGSLVVYDLAGNEVATLMEGAMDRGIHTVTWDSKDKHGNDVPTGVYLYQLTTSLGQETKTMLYMK